jgi:hypothetical protein
MVPNPISDSRKVPINDVNNSGADPPAAINVAPGIMKKDRRRKEVLKKTLFVSLSV